MGYDPDNYEHTRRRKDVITIVIALLFVGALLGAVLTSLIYITLGAC